MANVHNYNQSNKIIIANIYRTEYMMSISLSTLPILLHLNLFESSTLPFEFHR